MSPDLVNGLFEAFGGILLLENVRRLWKDKKISGVSWIPTGFFTVWGVWNLYFYPTVDCWYSFAGGVIVVVVNGTWLGLLGWYVYHARSSHS